MPTPVHLNPGESKCVLVPKLEVYTNSFLLLLVRPLLLVAMHLFLVAYCWFLNSKLIKYLEQSVWVGLRKRLQKDFQFLSFYVHKFFVHLCHTCNSHYVIMFCGVYSHDILGCSLAILLEDHCQLAGPAHLWGGLHLALHHGRARCLRQFCVIL